MNATTVGFQCRVCSQIYPTYSIANRCCPIVVQPVYGCSECDIIWATEKQAEQCCQPREPFPEMKDWSFL